MEKLGVAKKIISGIAIVVCLLGLFRITDPSISIDIALAILAVIFGIEAVIDYGKGKKGWMWFDIAAAAVLLVFAADKLLGIFR